MPADDVNDVDLRAVRAGAGPVVVVHDVVRGVVGIATLAVITPSEVGGLQGIDREVHELPTAAVVLA